MGADTESHTQILGRVQGVLWGWCGGTSEVRDTMRTQSTESQGQGLTGGLQRSGSLLGSDLDPLHICYCCIAWFSCGIPNSGTGGCLLLFYLLVISFSSYWVVLSNIDGMMCLVLL